MLALLVWTRNQPASIYLPTYLGTDTKNPKLKYQVLLLPTKLP